MFISEQKYTSVSQACTDLSPTNSYWYEKRGEGDRWKKLICSGPSVKTWWEWGGTVSREGPCPTRALCVKDG